MSAAAVPPVWLAARVAVLPLVVVMTGGCFATREDVRILQDNLTSMRTEQQAADSAHRVQVDRVLSQLALVNDSVRALNARTTKWQGDLSGDLYAMGQQLIQIQELTGQSQDRLRELRATLEEHAPTSPSAPGYSAAGGGGVSTGGPADTARGGGPGPNQLFQLALDQLRRGSTGAARSGFQDLLRQYPNADISADAQFYLAETYAKEGNMAAADTGYQNVVARYPTSPRAPTALFKHATALEAAGKVSAAKSAYQDVIKKYPRSDEAVLAKDRLRDLK